MWNLSAVLAAVELPKPESEPFSHFAPVGVLLLMAVAFGAGNLILTQIIGRTVGKRRQGPIKSMTYESGMNPVGTAHRRFNVRFYVVAVTFLVFDVEIVFLYPWATVFPSLAADSGLPVLFLARMLFFIATSVVAFAYAWRKGVFRYD
jgi:NADH-quinone oxidoreductase subunit A